jgi:hypothetical protein
LKFTIHLILFFTVGQVDAHPFSLHLILERRLESTQQFLATLTGQDSPTGVRGMLSAVKNAHGLIRTLRQRLAASTKKLADQSFIIPDSNTTSYSVHLQRSHLIEIQQFLSQISAHSEDYQVKHSVSIQHNLPFGAAHSKVIRGQRTPIISSNYTHFCPFKIIH